MAANSHLAPLYILFNVVAALSIVFANKAVFAVYRFPYPVYLTVIHTAFTTVGTHFMAMVRSLCVRACGRTLPCAYKYALVRLWLNVFSLCL